MNQDATLHIFALPRTNKLGNLFTAWLEIDGNRESFTDESGVQGLVLGINNTLPPLNLKLKLYGRIREYTDEFQKYWNKLQSQK